MMNQLFVLIITIVLTAALTFALTILFESVRAKIKEENEKRRVRDAEINLEKVAEFMQPIKVLQFLPYDETKKSMISVRLLGEKHPNAYIEGIISRHRGVWEKEIGAYNNEIYGVAKVDSYRITEKEEPFIVIEGYSVKYYEFLATNANVKIRNDLDQEEKEWLNSRIQNFDPYFPVQEFANPLSVEVLLLCENRRKAVLPVRSGKTVFRGDKLGASVMETVSPLLEVNDKINKEIDVYEVIKRGVKEELGISSEEIKGIFVTSLAFDEEVLDYKFTAVVDSILSQEEVQRRFDLGLASDRWENKILKFFKFPPDATDISEIRKNASPEAMAAVIMAEAYLYGWKRLERGTFGPILTINL
ncbi:MAG: hypothetical protein ACP5UZ_08455 [Thermoplasmata archaeon]